MWRWIPLRLGFVPISPAAKRGCGVCVGVARTRVSGAREVGPEQAMIEPSTKHDERSRCEAACRKLEEAIEELDDCGLDLYATHAHLCLELVREHLNHRDQG